MNAMIFLIESCICDVKLRRNLFDREVPMVEDLLLTLNEVHIDSYQL